MNLVLHGFASFIISVSTAGQGLVINPGASLISFNGNLTVTENLTNNGTLSAIGGTFVFAGTGQLINGSSISDFNNITVVSGSTATIQSRQKVSGKVLVNGSLNSDGFLTLVSTASGTALIDGSGSGQVSGNVTLERFLLSEFGYKYLSSPFQAAIVNELSDDIDLASYSTDVYSYDESRVSSGWIDYKSAGNIFEPLHGYAVNVGESAVPDTLDMTGIVNNGVISILLNNNNNTYTKGYNLIGNPYPSPIDWYASSGWVKNNIDDALYFFKASSADQYGGSYSTLTAGVSSDGIASNIIPSMQGFFVHVSDGAYPVAGSVQMDNNVRVVNQTPTFIKKSSGGTPLIRFSAGFSDNVTTVDNAVIYFDSEATHEFDSRLDALKLMNTDIDVPNMYFITPADRNLQIYALPPVFETLGRIPLGVRISREGYVIVKIKDIDAGFLNMRIFISDAVAGTEHDLIPDEEFKIFLNDGEYENRFFLNFSENAGRPDIITSTPETINSPQKFNIYYSGETLHTEIINQGAGSLTISNLLGQTLYTTRIYDDGYHEFNVHLKDGIYIATFTTGKTRTSKKIPIRN